MSAAVAEKPKAALPADLVRISTAPGAQIALELCAWPVEQQPANFAFLGALGELTGRLERSLNGYQEVRPMGVGVSLQGVDVTHIPAPEPPKWMTLGECDAKALRGVVGSINRRFPDWRLDVGKAVELIDRIDVHLIYSQLRRRGYNV
jgi:hypothetical protein